MATREATVKACDRGWQRAAAVTLAIAFGAVGPLRADTEDVPPPPVGASAVTVLSILQYNRNLCDSIAGRVLDRWQSLGESPKAERAIRDYLVRDEVSELAAGRAADDIVRSFFNQLRSETPSRTVESLERLRQGVQRLCDAVSWPSAPRRDFEARVRELLDEIEREQEELGGQLVVSQEELRAALEPYLAPIQIAGIEAHDEYLDYMESLKPKPRGPTIQELMAAWHSRYLEAVAPTKAALAKYFEARNANQTRALAGTCKEILAAVIPLLRDEEIFKIPTPQLPASKGFKMELLPPLLEAYREIRDLAVDCTAGRQREVLEHLQAMQQELNEAAAHLGRYSLAP